MDKVKAKTILFVTVVVVVVVVVGGDGGVVVCVAAATTVALGGSVRVALVSNDSTCLRPR